jgi:hypothetical protein
MICKSRNACPSAILLVATFHVLAVTSALAREPPEVFVRDGTLYLRGELNEEQAGRFFSVINDSVARIEITSFGGLGDPAIAIGSEIRRRHLPVIVDKYCFSACAQYVFLAAESRLVNELSLVAFHHTASSISSFSFAPEDETVKRWYAKNAATEQAFYRSADINEIWLYQPQLEIKPLCYSFRPGNSRGPLDFIYASTFQSWIPTKQRLTGLGVSADGFWPRALSEAVASAKHSLPPDSKANFVFGETTASEFVGEIRVSLAMIGPCKE